MAGLDLRGRSGAFPSLGFSATLALLIASVPGYPVPRAYGHISRRDADGRRELFLLLAIAAMVMGNEMAFKGSTPPGNGNTSYYH